MEIGEFKEHTLALLTEPETADLPDEVWWERFGELLDNVLTTRARARHAPSARPTAGPRSTTASRAACVVGSTRATTSTRPPGSGRGRCDE